MAGNGSNGNGANGESGGKGWRLHIQRRHRKLAEVCISHPEWPASKCLLEAGYKPAVARHHQTRTLARRSFRLVLQEELDRRGITDEKVLTRLSEALDYKETKFFKDQSLGDFVDNAGRLAAVQTAIKLKGWDSDARQYRIAVLQQVRADLEPILKECLDPKKLTKFAEMCRDLMHRYHAKPLEVEIQTVEPKAGGENAG